MNTIEAVCKRHDKDFIVRSYLYEPEEMAWFKEAYAKTSDRVMLQTKCEPHDWDPFYPNDAMIGAFPDRKQIIEFDGSAEFFGRNRIPFTQPEYFERRWRYDLAQPGVVGYNLRLDHAGYDAIHTPNEINIYARRSGKNGPRNVTRALDVLDGEAHVSAADPRIGNDPPCSAKEIRAFVTDMRKRADALAR